MHPWSICPGIPGNLMMSTWPFILLWSVFENQCIHCEAKKYVLPFCFGHVYFLASRPWPCFCGVYTEKCKQVCCLFIYLLRSFCRGVSRSVLAFTFLPFDNVLEFKNVHNDKICVVFVYHTRQRKDVLVVMSYVINRCSD